MKPELAKVGPAWDGGNIQKWPGVAGVAGQTNYLAHNTNPFLPDPVDSSSIRDHMVGGRRTRKRKSRKHRKTKKPRKLKKSKKSKKHITKRHQRGGSQHGNTIMPQSLVNLGRTMQYNAGNVWSSFMGEPAPVNPDPMVQPIGV